MRKYFKHVLWISLLFIWIPHVNAASTVTAGIATTTDAVYPYNPVSSAISVVSGDIVMWWSHAETTDGDCNLGDYLYVQAVIKQSTYAATTTQTQSGFSQALGGNDCGGTAIGYFSATTTQTVRVATLTTHNSNQIKKRVEWQKITDGGSAGCSTFACLTGTPTTVAGYGITDAVPTSRLLTIDGSTFSLASDRTWGISSTTLVKTTRTLTIDGSTFDLSANRTWAISSTTLVNTSRTLTINGTAFDLSANRSWTIATSSGGGLSTTTPNCVILGSDYQGNIWCMATTTMIQSYMVANTGFYALILFLLALVISLWMWRSFMH